MERSERHVCELLDRALDLELEGAVEVKYRYTPGLLAREYNGIGPEWIGEAVREKATKFFGLFEPAALIHDLDNYESDGTKDAFHEANSRFLANCRRLADARYSWWDLRRYRARGVARLLYAFVEGDGGWRAWMDCYRKRS